MTVRQSDDNRKRRAQPELDLTRPLPPEPILNLAALLEIPLQAIERDIFALLAARGHPDIRPAHSKLFSVISGTGSRVTDMAVEAMMTKQSMQYLVDDLERLGYAERIADPTDRRAKLIRLTPRGRAAVLVAREAIEATQRRWAKRLGGTAMTDLRRRIEELAKVAREEE